MVTLMTALYFAELDADDRLRQGLTMGLHGLKCGCRAPAQVLPPWWRGPPSNEKALLSGTYEPRDGYVESRDIAPGFARSPVFAEV